MWFHSNNLLLLLTLNFSFDCYFVVDLFTSFQNASFILFQRREDSSYNLPSLIKQLKKKERNEMHASLNVSSFFICSGAEWF